MLKNISEIKRVFKNQPCAIALVSSNEYARYLVTYLYSIKDHAVEKFCYDIVIFSKDMSLYYQNLIKDIFVDTNFGSP